LRQIVTRTIECAGIRTPAHVPSFRTNSRARRTHAHYGGLCARRSGESGQSRRASSLATPAGKGNPRGSHAPHGKSNATSVTGPGHTPGHIGRPQLGARPHRARPHRARSRAHTAHTPSRDPRTVHERGRSRPVQRVRCVQPPCSTCWRRGCAGHQRSSKRCPGRRAASSAHDPRAQCKHRWVRHGGTRVGDRFAARRCNDCNDGASSGGNASRDARRGADAHPPWTPRAQ